MRRTTVFAMTLLIGTAASAVVLGQGKNKNADTPVTADISNYDSGLDIDLEIQSDLGGAYVHSSTLTSLITSTGVWALDAYNVSGATRTVVLRFTEPIAGSGPNGGDPVAPASGNYKAWLYSSCNHFGNYPLLMSGGQTVSCPMAVRFDADGNEYVIHMNGTAQLETHPVNFTCISPASGTPCVQWRIHPSASDVGTDGVTRVRNVARLSRRFTSRGQTVVESQGNFYMSFSILLMK